MVLNLQACERHSQIWGESSVLFYLEICLYVCRFSGCVPPVTLPTSVCIFLQFDHGSLDYVVAHALCQYDILILASVSLFSYYDPTILMIIISHSTQRTTSYEIMNHECVCTSILILFSSEQLLSCLKP